MKKDIFLKTIIFSLGILIFSCSNGFTDKKTVASVPNNGKAYIVISDKTSVVRAQHTITPSAQPEDLTGFVLKGKRTELPDGTAVSNPAEQQLASEDTFEALQKKTIALDPGKWTFTLTAKLNGVDFTATLEDQIISAGITTPLAFELKTTVTNGGLDIKIVFPKEAATVHVDFIKKDENVKIIDTNYNADLEDKIFTDANNPDMRYIEISRGISTAALDPGAYDLTVSFYADNLEDCLNQADIEVIIAAGFTTSRVFEVLALNEAYSITYNENKPETNSGIVTDGSYILNYSRKTPEVTLPVLTLTGYVFGGWYDNPSFEGSPITGWTANERTGDLTLYARFIDTIYVTDGGVAYADGVDGTRESTALDSIDSAVSKIIDYANPSVNWKIVVVGEVKGCQNIDNALTTAHAASLTIMGKTGNETDILNANVGDTAVTDGRPLTVNTSVPVTIQDLKITGGNSSYGGGGISINNGASVTLESGTEISGNKASGTGSGGAIYSKGVLLIKGNVNIPYGGSEKNNDIYLDTNSSNEQTKITIAGALSDDISTICLDVPYNAYTSSAQIIALADSPDPTTTLAAACAKFQLIKYNATINSSDGKISPVIATVAGTPYYTVENTNAAISAITEADTEIVIGTGCTVAMLGPSTTADTILNSIKSISSETATVRLTVPAVLNISLPENAYKFFSELKKMTYADLRGIKTSSVTNMSYMFYNCAILKELNISTFDTSKVTTFGNMFYYCYVLETVDVSSFDTSNVTLMNDVFAFCRALPALDLHNWNTEKVTSMAGMFHECEALTELDVSSFDTSKVTNMWLMFDTCSSLTSITMDPQKFDTSSVTNMSSMFFGCSNLQALDVTHFNTTNVTQMEKMFNSLEKITELDLSSFDTSNVTTMESMFNSCKALTYIDLSSFDTSKVEKMKGMFRYSNKLETIIVSPSFTTSAVTDSGENMFANCSTHLKGGATTPTQWSSSNPTDKTYAKIDGGTSDPGYFTQAYAKVGSTFCKNKSETIDAISSATGDVTIVLYGGVGNDLGNAGSSGFIAYAIKTNTTADSFSVIVPASTNLALDLDHVTMWQNLFGGCEKLVYADLQGLDTTNATTLSFMFNGCTNLREVKLSSFNTSNVTMMKSMFNGCSNLTELDLSSFDTSNVTSMETMFSGCTQLKTIKVGPGFDTSSVTSSENMFDGCSAIVGGKGTEFDSSNVDKTYARADRGTTSPGYFTTEFLGTKMAPDSVGDIVFNDGTAEAYVQGMTLTDKQKAGAVAVIFNAGPLGTNDSTSRILGLGLKNSYGTSSMVYNWAKNDTPNSPGTNGTTGYSTKFNNIQISRSLAAPAEGTEYYQYEYGSETQYYTGDFDGSDNWSEICSQDPDGTSTNALIADNYPAFDYVNNYASNAGLTGTYATGWYMPTVVELIYIYQNKDTLNTILGLFGNKANSLGDNVYWSSSQYDSGNDYQWYAWEVSFSDGFANGYGKNSNLRVCVIRDFSN